MKTILMLFLAGTGLVLLAASPAFGQAESLSLNPAVAGHMLNIRIAPTDLSDSPVSHSYPARVNSQTRSATAEVLDLRTAILAGVVTLMLLQRRHHTDNVLKPRH